MNCPYCNKHFGALLALGILPVELPCSYPIVCSACGEWFLVHHDDAMLPTKDQIEFLKTQPVWQLIQSAQRAVAMQRKAKNAVNN